MGDLVAIITLAILVIAQLVERYFYSRDMTKKLTDCMKDVMSRNINEFMAVTQDKTPKQAAHQQIVRACTKPRQYQEEQTKVPCRQL